MDWDLLLVDCALSLALAAAVFDVQQQRIPNWLTLPGVIAGILLRFVLFGWKGLLSALAGCLIAGGIMFLFYLVRAMGAGDVKLLAAIGSLVGTRHAVAVLLATAISGGVLALVVVLSRRKAMKTLRNLGSVVRFHFWTGMHAHPDLNLDNPSALRMPYGLAIAAGTFYAAMATWQR
jgi:prepilin peptidase CpaA